ncbi:molybdopterin molybdotransferase MoeA [Candidatus Bathyarchaeota archaeon]|nr:molybdopterin molybdotransferase MoeA [Candidatus Bathyarchaeota archaeon]
MVRLKGFKKLMKVEEALKVFLDTVKPRLIGKEKVPLDEAYGRILASDIRSKVDIPPFDKALMDGFAVRAKDTEGASIYSPRKLKVVSKGSIGKLEAKRIWTGNPIPEGADAVIELERTKVLNDEIEITAQVAPGRNISVKGEDVKKGEIAVKAGVRLKPQHLGLAASLGLTHLEVAKKPKVFIVSTGDELVKVGEKPSEGKIIDSNKPILSSMCRELGAEPIDGGIVKDYLAEIASAIDRGLRTADMVVTSGGTSVGEHDLTPAAIGEVGGQVIVHGVAVRPGMPTALGLVRGKPIVALSGNPVAAIVGFELFVRPTILALLGAPVECRPLLKAKLSKNVSSTLGFEVFLRVKVSLKSGEFIAEPVRAKGSSIISSMTEANGYVLIPPDREGLLAGEEVVVHLLDSIGVESCLGS